MKIIRIEVSEMKENQSRENKHDFEHQQEKFVVCCGEIKPIVIPEQKEEEDKECTEQS